MSLNVLIILAILKLAVSDPVPDPDTKIDVNIQQAVNGGSGCKDPVPVLECPVICTQSEGTGVTAVCGGTADGIRKVTFYNRCYLDAAIKCDPVYAQFVFKYTGNCNLTIAWEKNNDDCDCDYHAGGCMIVRAAPANNACKCSYKGGWTCAGTGVDCVNPGSEHCINPHRGYDSCKQGGGDCGGYTCDCDYHSGGCTISAAPPPNWACHCSYKGGWSCGGSLAGCQHPNSDYCINPGYNKGSCKEGGGDCGGY